MADLTHEEHELHRNGVLLFQIFFLTYCNQISLVRSGVPAFLILAHADITQKTAGSYYA